MKKLRSLLVVWAVAVVVAVGVWAPQPAHAADAADGGDLAAGNASIETAAKKSDPLIGVWTGSYLGFYGNDEIKRTIRMEVEKHSGGKFSGRMTITSESACWYLFEGTYDADTGECSFAGTEWLQNSAGLDFAHFDGVLNKKKSTITGTVDGNDRTFTLKRASKELTAYSGPVEKLNRVWKGDYDGRAGWTVVRRDYIINITSYAPTSGKIKGTAYIKPSKLANAENGVNGSYRFSGTFNKSTGRITLQGHTWIQYPVGEVYDSFDFVKLVGYIDSTGTKISGMSGSGIWQMSTEKKSKLFGNAKTSQGYRYPKKYKKTQAAYPALANLTSVATYGMPGLEKSSSMAGSTTKMVPQGICVAKDYILITAYCANEEYCSAIYVLSKKTGKLLKTLETSDANHVGGIAFDGKRVYVARSTQNEVGVIDYSTIAAAVKKKGNVASVYYAKTINVWQKASLVTYYDGKLWVGTCALGDEGAYDSYMKGYTISGAKAEETELSETVAIFELPKYMNGADFAKVDGKVRLAVNVSPGRAKDSTRYVYNVNVDTGKKSLVFKQIQPPMMEESCVAGDKTYTIFESAATKYSTLASGIPCKYIVDRVCVGKTSQLFSATVGTYVSLGAKANAASYRIVNNKKLVYAAPSPFNTSKSLSVPSVGAIGKIERKVTGIESGAFAYAGKTKVLAIATTALTPNSVRNCLTGSKVVAVKVPREKAKTYKEAFSKANCGKKVTVKS